MIAAIRGQVLAKEAAGLVIDVSGVGYSVAVVRQVVAGATIGDQIQLHTTLIVREDAFLLFGFATVEQRALFDLLRSVTGVGPKTALAILSHLDADAISSAVANEDAKPFESVSGIGAKTARLITVTLAGKLVAAHSSSGTVDQSVLAALIGLGWNEKQASEAITAAKKQSNSTTKSDELLRTALKQLSSR